MLCRPILSSEVLVLVELHMAQELQPTSLQVVIHDNDHHPLTVMGLGIPPDTSLGNHVYHLESGLFHNDKLCA